MAKKVVLKDNSGNICYPVTRDECIKCGDTTLDQDRIKKTTELNISVLYPTNGDGGTNKYTLAGGIAQVPSEYRTIVGLKITFINNSTSLVETWVYNGGTFTSTASWTQGDGSGGNLILEWNTDVATTRKQVLQQERKKLLQISYENADGDVINEQYIGTVFTDTEWEKDANWNKIPSQEQVDNLSFLTENYLNESVLKNYNTGIGTNSSAAYSTEYVQDNSVFGKFLDYALYSAGNRSYLSLNQNTSDEILDSLERENNILLSFWTDLSNLADNSLISIYILETGATVAIGGTLKDLNAGLKNQHYDGNIYSYDFEWTKGSTLGGLTNIQIRLKNISKLRENPYPQLKIAAISIVKGGGNTTDLTLTNVCLFTFAEDIDFNPLIVYKEGISVKEQIDNINLLISQLEETVESNKDEFINSISETNNRLTSVEASVNMPLITLLNEIKGVGTDKQSVFAEYLVDDDSSPFSGILPKMIQLERKADGATQTYFPSVQLTGFDRSNNTHVYAVWVKLDCTPGIEQFAGIRSYLTLDKIGLVATGAQSFLIKDWIKGNTVEYDITHEKVTCKLTFRCDDIIDEWYKIVITYSNMVLAEDVEYLKMPNAIWQVSEGYIYLQAPTILFGKDINYINEPSNVIYPDGEEQLQYPDSIGSIAALAKENKSDIAQIKEDLSNSSGSPLKGKYIAWVADSLLEVCANIVEGNPVPQNYNTLDESDKDEKALGYNAGLVGGNISNTSYNVNWPYWISKRTRCINHIFGQSGQSIFGWAADNAKEYFYWYYKTVGRIVGYKSEYDRLGISYTDNDGTYALRTEYTPDFIILSFGTNDNVSLVNVDTLPTLDALPPEGGEEYINKTYRLTTDGTFWSWKDDGTGGEGIPHYSWVQVFPKTIGSYETSWKDGSWDETTLWGCYAKVITYYRQKWPNVKMGIILDGQTSREQRNAFLRICKAFAIGFLDLQTIPYPPMYNNIRGYSISGEPYKQENDFPKGCIVRKDGKDYISLCDIPANSEWDSSKWGYSVDNTLRTKSPVALGQADRDNMPSITRRSEGNYSKGEDIFIWGDYQAMLCSYDLFVHPTLYNAKIKSQIVENWLLTL
ncbi:hypothetical protein H6A66_12060 [Bacteroides caecigallinarum]|uniref:hypothetical protein n=1 Tax=Bacteroides caecigallinarum TaxID=1411144 RepID=UPI00195E6D73|nr:hypothetical protein [Bacteroides caecigallinarum]MBM6865900.1 hypothetical protein [Bacteroides caecigallinarum]